MLLKSVKTALMLWLQGNDPTLRAAIFCNCRHTYKYTHCHTTLGGLSSVYAELEPASSKSNEILEINVLQKFTPCSSFLRLIASLATAHKNNLNCLTVTISLSSGI